jgi:hypothetical protein
MGPLARGRGGQGNRVTAPDRPVFVVGAPRSGTTLVQCILSANSRAYSLPETHFFSMVLPALNSEFDAALSTEQLSRAEAILATEADITAPRLGAGTTPRELLVAILDAYRPSPEKSRVIEKTPLHVEHLPVISNAFPDALFIHVVRNPVDAVSSWLRVPFASTRSVISCAQSWSAAVAKGAATTERIITVLYERLVQEPEAHVRTLCEFAELAFEPRMLEEFGREAARNVGKSESWKAEVASGQIMNRDQIWRERLTPGQAWLVERATESSRRRYGYADRANATAASIAVALISEARVRFGESRGFNTVGSSLRHAASPIKLLLAPL